MIALLTCLNFTFMVLSVDKHPGKQHHLLTPLPVTFGGSAVVSILLLDFKLDADVQITLSS